MARRPRRLRKGTFNPATDVFTRGGGRAGQPHVDGGDIHGRARLHHDVRRRERIFFVRSVRGGWIADFASDIELDARTGNWHLVTNALDVDVYVKGGAGT